MPRSLATTLAATAATAVAVVVSACSSSPSVPPPGSERGACRAERRCDVGLECWSDRCVRPPPADCPAVAERLASVRLGNYATREERASLVGALTAQCRTELLTAAEGRCVVEAADEPALKACPRPLLPELTGGDPAACRAIGAKVKELAREVAAGEDPLGLGLFGPDLSRVGREVEASCREQRWPSEVTECAIESITADDIVGCARRLPDAARADLARRLGPLMPPAPPPRPVDPDDPWAATAPAGPRVKKRETAAVPVRAAMPGVPQPCTDYMAILDRWAACPTTPPDSAASLRQATSSMRTSMAQLAQLPPDGQAAAASACQQALDSVRQAIAQAGC